MEQTAINTEAPFWQRMSQAERMDLLDIIIQMEEAGLNPETELLKVLVETRRQKKGNS